MARDAPVAWIRCGLMPAPDSPQPPAAPAGPVLSRRRLVHWALTVAMIGLITWLVLRNLNEVSSVTGALRRVGPVEAVALVGLLILWRLLVAGQLAMSVPGLGLGRSVVADESSAAVSNIVPGPSGSGTRLMMLRSWGFPAEQFAESITLTGSLGTLVVLAMPAAVVGVAAIERRTTVSLALIASAGLAASVVGVAIVVAILRSERFARRAGALGGRVLARVRRLARRPPGTGDAVEATLRFRRDITGLWHARGRRLAALAVAAYCVQWLVLVVAARAVGLGSDVMPLLGLAVGFSVVTLIALVSPTPGGVGFVEAFLTSIMLTTTAGHDRPEVVATVLLFRGLTYLGPILSGVVCLVVWRLRTGWRADQDPTAVAAPAPVAAAVPDATD